MQTLKNLLLDLLFPPRCAFCGKLLDTSAGICPDCEASLPYREEENIVSMIGENRYLCARTFYYEDMVQAGIKALKFGKKSWRAGVFAGYIAQTAAEQFPGGFDAVTFVPVSLRRNFQRGFDQGRLLAVGTAGTWGHKAEPVLRKIRHTRAQSSLHDPGARKQNVRDAYRVPDPGKVRGRRFLLIDDVCTTGSTLSAAADALMEAGAAGVVCAVLAGGHRETENDTGPVA